MEVTDFIGEEVIYDEAGQMIFGKNGEQLQLIANVRGWGAIQHLFDNEDEAIKFQDKLGEFMAQAINEKLGVK